MTVNLETTANIEMIKLIYTDNGDLPVRVDQAHSAGVFFFAGAPGETHAETMDRCAQNLAVGADNQPGQIYWQEQTDSAVIYPTHLDLREDNLLQTRLPPAPEIYVLALVRCRDPNIGLVSANRGHVIGTYGNGTVKGWSLYFNSSLQLKAVTYDGSGVSRQAVLPYAGTETQRWTLVELCITATEITLRDLTRALTNTSPAFVGGHNPGSQTVTVAGRVTSGTDYDVSIRKEIPFIIYQTKVPDAAGRAAFAVQARHLIAEFGLVEDSGL